MNLPFLVSSLRPRRSVAGLFLAFTASCLSSQPASETGAGYYRFPTIQGSTVVFTAEGDLWRAGVGGGVAQRLTRHAAMESYPALSPEGKWLAFSAQYEGPTEVYVMPVAGGLPKRLTFDGDVAFVRGWTRDGRVLYSTPVASTLPNRQLATVHPVTLERTLLPLAQADEGAFDEAGLLYFTRFSAQSSHAKRYAGGTAQSLWRFDPARDAEAVPLTASYPGTSRAPMWWQGRLYFASDRDGTMNLWSMDASGGDLRQHTRHADFGIKFPALEGGRVVYQNGADLWLFDIASGRDAFIPLTLMSDFDQTQETWVTKPMPYLTGFSLSPTGDRVALTVRGQVFVAPTEPGRLVEASRLDGVRYRQASFLPEGKSLLTLSDESGEVEFWTLPANGVGARRQLTRDATNLRMAGLASPDGKWIASAGRNQQLVVIEVATGNVRPVATSPQSDFDDPDLAWSPDSRWLAYTVSAPNLGFPQIHVYQLADGTSTPVTSERTVSGSPAWSADGKWLYFASERNLESSITAPWGYRHPEPVFENVSKLYALALVPARRSPFEPRDETTDASAEDAKPDAKPKTPPAAAPDAAKDAPAAAPAVPEVKIDFNGLATRLWELPAPPGNYSRLAVAEKHLLYLGRGLDPEAKARLLSLEIKDKDAEPVVVLEGVESYQLSADRKKVAVRKDDRLHVFAAGPKAPDKLDKSTVDLSKLKFAYTPRENWRQIFTDAWRLHRDYFYDPAMHGVDWKANLAKHLPLVARVTDRAELNDAIAYLVSELSTLHTAVAGGDLPEKPTDIAGASLGAEFARDEAAGGWRLTRFYRTDPDYPAKLGPLQKPGLSVQVGDVLESLNGIATSGVPQLGPLLRNQAGRQVLLRFKPAGAAPAYDLVVTPITPAAAQALRYDDWELSRREAVEQAGDKRLGYVHLRAMGPADITQWARDYYPILHRDGLILDLRHNRGGNIDSWILNRLLRKSWMSWQPRVGDSFQNMQEAFRGHLVVLVNESTASDGETAANGVRQLGLGKIIGTRTWGGGVWLRAQNTLVDKGIATAAEFGSFSQGAWAIEGHGLEPDIVVDNLPHATFQGRDAQLEAAISYLQQKIAAEPVKRAVAPAYPTPARRP